MKKFKNMFYRLFVMMMAVVMVFGIIAVMPGQVAVADSHTFSTISAGGQHSLAVRTDGSLWFWGRKELFTGYVMTIAHTTPERVDFDNNWAYVSAGNYHSVAIRTDGSLWAWGRNYSGQLGDGTYHDRPFPIRIGSDNNWASISAGRRHTVAVRTDGSLWTWGGNMQGQLGDGTTTLRLAPVRIGFDNNWASVATGGGVQGWDHSAAVRTDGSLWTCA